MKNFDISGYYEKINSSNNRKEILEEMYKELKSISRYLYYNGDMTT